MDHRQQHLRLPTLFFTAMSSDTNNDDNNSNKAGGEPVRSIQDLMQRMAMGEDHLGTLSGDEPTRHGTFFSMTHQFVLDCCIYMDFILK